MKYSLNFVLESSHFPKLMALCTLISALEPRRKRLIQKPPNKPTFDSLPHEVRFLIWKYAAPGPRVIFQHPENNKSLPLLSVCRESRAIAKTQYTPLHLPSPKLAHSPSKYFAFLYVDLNKDTVVRDLSENMNPSPETALLTWELHSLFYESGSACRSSCVRHFWGLALVKSLTIPFNMEEDMRRIFGSLVYCCPNLEVLNLVPTSQLRPQKRQYPLPEGCERAKLIPVDRQLIDYVDYRLVRITNRRIRRNKASRVADKLAKLFSASKELRDVELPKFIKERMCGVYWNPTLQVCIVAMWRACPGQKEESHGWYSRYLSGDYYTKGYTGDDGEFHHGFLECLNLMGEDDFFLDQYKGMASIFE
ncbi:hypothetical protein HYALB_00004561 [Hymenoscyphus albidus]|uniref:2EXR domain-containing protein n=1 Tax=Hymenoscyphus albidus TaxID=595503 RepID=A0A9N9M0A9_9HELO|nr:hypothetical protein HYALB_00004561 [Hymenoscyphus albidus]